LVGQLSIGIEAHYLMVRNPAQFDESSNYIMGWLRDYLAKFFAIN
jgi:hypothetical protein